MSTKKINTIERPPSALSKTQKNNLNQPTQNIEEYIEILYQHQKKCQKQGKYIQAETSKKRVKQLRQQLEKRMRSDIKFRHERQKQQIEEAHRQQFNNFNNDWEQKMIDFNNQISQIEDQILHRHQQQLAKYEEQINNAIPTKPKQSAEVINLRRIQQNLAKVQNYLDAHKVQVKIQELQKQQFNKYAFERNKKIQNLMLNLKLKQQSELKALRQKIEANIDEKKKYKSIQLEKLLQKYTNIRKELQYQQNQEISKFEKAKKLQSTMNFSKISHSKQIK